VVFADADISAAGEWACSRSDLVVDTARALHVIEEELFSFKRGVLKGILG